MRLDKMTWKQAEKLFDDKVLAVLPVGSVEQHGPIGPLGTDYLIPEYLAQQLEQRVDVLVLPAIPYGVCPHHMSFPGTINIGHEALLAVITNITASLMQHGIKRFLIINGHGGNSQALETAGLQIYKKGGIAALIDWWSLAPELNPSWLGGHGDGQEASAMMVIKPDWVDKDNLFAGRINHLSANLINTHLNQVKYQGATVKIIRNVRDVASSGAFGGPDDSALANQELGQKMLTAVIEYIASFAAEFKAVPLPRI